MAYTRGSILSRNKWLIPEAVFLVVTNALGSVSDLCTPEKKDKDRIEGKGHRCCLGDGIC